jgi:tungstate transport system ATP-binding protein
LSRKEPLWKYGIFQKPVLLNRSVTANVAYGLNVRGRRGKSVEQAVAASLSQVGLKEMAKTSARTLSGGEAQRVALARALVVKPKVLLMDLLILILIMSN